MLLAHSVMVRYNFQVNTLNRQYFPLLSLLMSFVIHLLFLMISFEKKVEPEVSTNRIFKIKRLETIKKKGVTSSLEKEGNEKQSSAKRLSSHKSQQKLKDPLPLSKLRPQNFNPTNPRAKKLLRKKVTKIERINPQEMKGIARNSPRVSSPTIMRLLQDNEMSVSFGIPDGEERDELNPKELVFYGFKKRLAENYISAFFNKLRSFETQNPHKQFPMSRETEEMTGMVVYDAMGNIVRVKIVKWTDKKDLQEFFLELLQNLGTLQNPPEEILQNNQFAIFYSLNIRQ